MNGLCFQFQSGTVREQFSLPVQDLSLRRLRQEAVHFVNKHYPQQTLGERLIEHILLYRHDFRSVNILELVQSAEEVAEGCLLEIVISPCPQHERLVVHPHTLYVHSYKTPTFCDFCGELLFGLVKQGLKCQGCGLNYHKRCASKIPNNCSGSRQRRPSAIPLSPRNSIAVQGSPTVVPCGSSLTPSSANGLCPFVPPATPSSAAEPSSALPAPCVNCTKRPSTASTTTTFVASLAASAELGGGPAICVTGDVAQHDDGDPIGGNFLQMPRKDRSSSWSGRPLWMEVAEATRIKVPHTFQVHSYKRPTVCQHCKKLLKGLIRQGLQCRDCKYNCHKKCAQHVAKDCSGGFSTSGSGGDPGSAQSQHPDGGGRGAKVGEQKSAQPGGIMERLRWMKSEPLDESDGSTTEDSVLNDDSSGSLLRPHKRTQATPSAPLSCSQRESGEKENELSLEKQLEGLRADTNAEEEDAEGGAANRESQNIPLMRIVMSKKQTKRPTTAKVLREGWMVHYTERHSMRKKHFWRLDPKAITMFKDESASGYYKEIPLSEVLDVKTAAAEHAELARTLTHFFEIRTHTSTYFIAGAPQPEDESDAKTSSARRSAAVNAAQWALAIKQALMPVTPQSSGAPSVGAAAREKADSLGGKEMTQLKVPQGGAVQDIGHLGVQIQSEQEFSQLYQIFADDILGSGQFGTVYGGIQRKTGRHVAVKLIDKLKFPSNKEAALRTEVEILQKVRHLGVVEFQQMLETPDRIFVVMEKLKGDMLEMILSSEKGRLSERITQYLVHQILISLQYLHNQNIVHCDLKPENILLTSDSDFPQVKLCDFGFARIIGERSFRRSVVGTPAYLAPEVLRNKGFNRSLDMWSVGVIVYVSLSGTFPFNEDEDINDQIQNAEFMYPPNPWKEVGAEAIEFISSLLQVKMSKRLTVSKALSHIWLQGHQLWSDLRVLEKEVGERFLTHPSDDQRWRDFERESGIKPVY